VEGAIAFDALLLFKRGERGGAALNAMGAEAAKPR